MDRELLEVSQEILKTLNRLDRRLKGLSDEVSALNEGNFEIEEQLQSVAGDTDKICNFIGAIDRNVSSIEYQTLNH